MWKYTGAAFLYVAASLLIWNVITEDWLESAWWFFLVWFQAWALNVVVQNEKNKAEQSV